MLLASVHNKPDTQNSILLQIVLSPRHLVWSCTVNRATTSHRVNFAWVCITWASILLQVLQALDLFVLGRSSALDNHARERTVRTAGYLALLLRCKSRRPRDSCARADTVAPPNGYNTPRQQPYPCSTDSSVHVRIVSTVAFLAGQPRCMFLRSRGSCVREGIATFPCFLLSMQL